MHEFKVKSISRKIHHGDERRISERSEDLIAALKIILSIGRTALRKMFMIATDLQQLLKYQAVF